MPPAEEWTAGGGGPEMRCERWFQDGCRKQWHIGWRRSVLAYAQEWLEMTLAGVRTERPSVRRRALTGDDALQIAFNSLGVDDSRFLRLDASSPLALQLQSVFGSEGEPAVLLLIHASAVSFSGEQYRRLPVLRPYAIRDGRKRKGSGGSELWGVPDELGYFSDDNSLLKALPKGMDIVSGDPRVAGRRVTTGWTCCHAWRMLPTGAQASKLGLLNSFVPGVTWIPTSIAHFTDREGSPAQHLLKDIAMSFVGDVPAPLRPYVDRAWSLLVPNGVEQPRVSPRHRFAFSETFVSRRVQSIRKVVQLLEDPPRYQNSKLLNSRYRAGVADLDDERREALATALTGYADAVLEAPSATAWEGASPPFPGSEK